MSNFTEDTLALLKAAALAAPKGEPPQALSGAEVATFARALAAIAKDRLGNRFGVVVFVGGPDVQSGHDVWASGSSGPCLTVLGLVEHASQELRNGIKFKPITAPWVPQAQTKEPPP